MAEALVHEYSHSLLNLASRQDNLLVNDKDETLHYSPFRSDARPIIGVLHAAFSFANVCYLFMQFMADERYQKQLKDRFCDYVCRLILCVNSLQKFVGFSNTGSNLCLSIKAATKIFKNSGYFKPSKEIILSRQRHYQKWLIDHSSAVSNKIYNKSFIKNFNELTGDENNKTNLSPKPYLYLEEMSYKEFKTKHKQLNNVVLIRDADIWKGGLGKSKELINLLSTQKFRQINLNLHRGYSTTPDQYVSLSKHGDQFRTRDENYHGYIGAQPVSKLINLESFWKDKNFLEDFYLNNQEQVIFFNELGTKVLMHWDSGNNVHLMLSGQKKFAFLKPGQHEFLRKFTEGYEEAFSGFDPFDYLASERNNSDSEGGLIFTQEVSAGDLLFIPSGWWHSVFYKSDSMALSLFDRF